MNAALAETDGWAGRTAGASRQHRARARQVEGQHDAPLGFVGADAAHGGGRPSRGERARRPDPIRV